jgi:hypothetical protein
MTIEEAIYTILSSNATITALVPASRIKVPGDWQNIERPYIVHQVSSLQPTRTHTGLASLRTWDYQINIIADTYSAGRALTEAVIVALDGWHVGIHCALNVGPVYVGGVRDGLEAEEFAVTFSVSESLTTSPA